MAFLWRRYWTRYRRRRLWTRKLDLEVMSLHANHGLQRTLTGGLRPPVRAAEPER